MTEENMFQFTFPTSNSDYSLELFKNNLNKLFYSYDNKEELVFQTDDDWIPLNKISNN